MSSRTLIRGGCVLTLGVKTPNFTEADVLIEDGKVAEVGRGLRARDAEVVDATDTIVMPGFVDTHRHFWESLFRNIGVEGGASPEDYGPHYQPDDVYAATLIGLLSAVDAGITTAVDWCDVGTEEGHVDAALQAHADSGIRSVFAYGAAAWSEGDWTTGLRRLTQGPAKPLLTPAAGPRERHGSPEALASDWALARELGLRIHAHTRALTEPRMAFDQAPRDLLGRDVTLVHCSNLTDPELDAVASSGAAVSLTPSSEMAGGRGSLPIQKLIDRGIRPGLGVDTERLAPGDMFAQMRAAISIQHATSFDLKLAGKAGLPRLMTTREVMRYATVDGARVAGLGTETGHLEPGMQADLIVLRTDRPNIHPVNDPIGAVVWGMDTSNVDWVFVAGRALKRNGAIEADIAPARSLAAAARQRVMVATDVFAGARGAAG
jgi:cytosine/adenosine deaminase-related metal-dependent hydrolase